MNLYSSIELRHLGIWSLNRKAFDTLTDDLKTTFNLMSLLQVRIISISCLFTSRDVFPKNSNDIIISFSVELSLTFFLFINNLSKISWCFCQWKIMEKSFSATQILRTRFPDENWHSQNKYCKINVIKCQLNLFYNLMVSDYENLHSAKHFFVEDCCCKLVLSLSYWDINLLVIHVIENKAWGLNRQCQ